MRLGGRASEGMRALGSEKRRHCGKKSDWLEAYSTHFDD